MDRIVLVFLAFFVTTFSAEVGDRTVGLFINEEDSYEGYTLFAPMSYKTTYLIDNEGQLIHSWESDHYSGQCAYLTEDGYLYRALDNFVTPEGPSGGFQKLDWDGNVVWHYQYTSDEYHYHHDIEVLPNGNVLALAWEYKDSVEVVENGRDPQLIVGQFVVDFVMEIEQTSDSSGNIVWRWHTWDHLVQDFDSTKENYGDIAENPGLTDLNYFWQLLPNDWTHMNSVDYNEEFDQVLLSPRDFNEIWVIDHSTTIEEAEGHTGGRYGKGGSILYRWGNPKAYGRGGPDDRRLFGQHDAQWIEPGRPGAGNILIFNNGSDREYSSVDEIVPPVDENGYYSLDGQAYGPEEPAWIWTAPDPYDFYAEVFSGAQRLANGNTLICNGPEGEFLEVSPEDDVVWRYVNPVGLNGPVNQGDSVTNNAVYKIRRYAPDYPGLAGRDLTPKGPIEKYSTITESTTLLTTRSGSNHRLVVNPSFIKDNTLISYHLTESGHVQILLYNVFGQKVKTLVNEIKGVGNHGVIWEGNDDFGQRLGPGIYFCKLQIGEISINEKLILK